MEAPLIGASLVIMENQSLFYTILDGASSTGAGNAVDVEAFDYVIISVDIDSTSTLTVQFQGSIDYNVDFDSSQSSTNTWVYLAGSDLNQEILQGSSSITGGNGVSVSSGTAHKLVGINVRGLKWITSNVTSYSSGSVTSKIRTYAV